MTPSKPGEPVYDLFFDWYGEQVHSTTAGASAYAGSKGSILAGFRPPVTGLNGRRWGWSTAPGSASTCAAACSPMLGCMLTASWTATSAVPSSGT